MAMRSDYFDDLIRGLESVKETTCIPGLMSIMANEQREYFLTLLDSVVSETKLRCFEESIPQPTVKESNDSEGEA